MSAPPLFAQLCTSLGYVQQLNITNVESKHCFGNSTLNFNCDNSQWYAALNISSAVQPGNTTPGDGWSYIASDVLSTLLPLSDKPLSIECPMPICIYGITGFYSSWQRYLFITNVAVAIVAVPLTVLRGVAQIYVTIMGFISAIMMYTIISHEATPQTIFDADFFPACQFFSCCWILCIWWLLLRKGIKGTAVLMAGNRATGPRKFVLDPSRVSGTFQERLQTVMFSAAIPILWIMGMSTVAAVAYDLSTQLNVPAVVVSSASEYRITSPCYADAGGMINMWHGSPNNVFRQQNELQLVVPPMPAEVTDIKSAGSLASRSLSIARPVKWWEFATPLFVVSGGGLICVVAFMFLNEIDLGVFPSILFRIILVGSGIASFAIIEKRILENGIPQAEVFRQVGQWAPWTASILVGIGTVVYRLSGLDEGASDDDEGSRRGLFDLGL